MLMMVVVKAAGAEAMKYDPSMIMMTRITSLHLHRIYRLIFASLLNLNTIFIIVLPLLYYSGPRFNDAVNTASNNTTTDDSFADSHSVHDAGTVREGIQGGLDPGGVDHYYTVRNERDIW